MPAFLHWIFLKCVLARYTSSFDRLTEECLDTILLFNFSCTCSKHSSEILCYKSPQAFLSSLEPGFCLWKGRLAFSVLTVAMGYDFHLGLSIRFFLFLKSSYYI